MKKQIYILNDSYASLASATKGITFSSISEITEFLNDCGIEINDPLDAVRLIRDGETVKAPAYKQDLLA